MLSTKYLSLPTSVTATLRNCSRFLSSPAIKQFEDIPTPKRYPLIGTALDYRNDKNTMNRVMKKRFDKYGNIYRETMFAGLPEQVVVCTPSDVETVFRADGEWPKRPVGGDLFDAILEEAKVTTPGLFVSQGEQWHRMRSPMSKFMMVPRKVGEYHEDFNNITAELLYNIEQKKNNDSSLLSDVPKLLFNWSFESASFFALGKRLGALNVNGGSPESQQFIKVVGNFFVDFLELIFSLPLYKLYRTKKWKAVVNGQIAMQTLANSFIDEKLAEIDEEDKRALEAVSGEEEAPDKVDFITYLIHSGKLSREEVSMTIIDLLTAGVETTSYTLAWALYLLGSNLEVQEKLRNEVMTVVGSDKIVTPAHTAQMKYLRNVLRETQRLYPVAALNQRILTQDVVLSGYNVPKGKEILMPQIITSRMPDLYTDPDQFIPERWSKENKDKLPSSFANLPFGFGPRMCVGRRVAELELHIALAHLIREYKVEYLDKEPLGIVMNFLVNPDRQLDLVFKKI